MKKIQEEYDSIDNGSIRNHLVAMVPIYVNMPVSKGQKNYILKIPAELYFIYTYWSNVSFKFTK